MTLAGRKNGVGFAECPDCRGMGVYRPLRP